MTAFDFVDLAVAFGSLTGEWPDYSEDNVNVPVKLDVHEDGTVTISYLHVPLLDVDDFLVLMGTPAVRADVLDALANAVADKFSELAESLPIPFEVTEIV